MSIEIPPPPSDISPIPSPIQTRKETRGRKPGFHTHYKVKQDLILSSDEIFKKFDECRDINDEDRSFFVALYYSGCRRSEIYTLRISDIQLTSARMLLTIHRKKHSHQTPQIPFELSWRGMDYLIKLYNKRKDFKPTSKYIQVFDKNLNPPCQIEHQKDRWLFLNMSGSHALTVIKRILGTDFYCHYLRLLRVSELCNHEVSIGLIRSWTGLSLKSIEHYLGMDKRQIDKAAGFITQDQPKSPNIAANTESQTSS